MGVFRSAQHRIAYRVVNPLVDRVITVSEAVRNEVLRNERLDPQRVVTVYNGAEPEAASMEGNAGASRASLGLEGASHVIATVANIRPIKGIDNLVRAAAIVCREYPHAVFLVIGQTNDREHFSKLQELVDSLRLRKNVVFVGKSNDVSMLLRLSDVFCLLSRSEGFSNAIVEAMGCGLPCVVTEVGGNSEAVHDGRNGFVVPSEDANAAAQRIIELLRSPQRAKEMGEEGHRNSNARFSVHTMMSRLLSVYEDVLDSRRELRGSDVARECRPGVGGR
jgi:glycosyltransferase involved in cell wall biosynthesis